MARTKYSERFCGYCNKAARMELIGEMHSAAEKTWFKCTRCHHMTLVDMKAELSNGSGNKADANTAALYNPQQTFTVGQSIFHTVWDDVGKIVSKTRTSDGNQAIVVSFEKTGQRTLIENFKTEA